MSENIDIFKSIIFKVPTSKQVFGFILGSGAVFGLIINLILYWSSSTAINLTNFLLIVLGIFIIPTLFSGELFYQFLPEFRRKWSYFLTFFNEIVIFSFGTITAFIGNNVLAWNIFWLGIITIFLISLIALLATLGYRHMKRISILSLVQPLMITVISQSYLNEYFNVTIFTYLERMGALIFAGIILLLTFLVSEYLIGTNVNASALQLLSGLIQKKQEVLDLGYPVKPDVQTLAIKNELEETQIAVPWIHPGPLEGFGGGRASTDIINELNKDGTGFFFHVPSTHKSDPVDPEDIEKIINTINTPQKIHKISKMIMKSYENLKLYGRRIGNKKIIFIDAEDYGDYEIEVFKEILDLNEVMLVDLHNHKRHNEPKNELIYDTNDASIFRENLLDFIKNLEDLNLYDYKAGFSVESKGIPQFVLIEKVKNQKTIIFGTEGNGISDEMETIREKIIDEYDEVLLFTTDTHSSIHKMTANKHIDINETEKLIKKSEDKCSSASIGFNNSKSETMKLLKDDYLGLTYSINIIARLVPLTLLILYLSLILWIL